MEMAQMSDAYRRLHCLVGTWSGDEKMSPAPWDPTGGPATGKSVNRAILDGFAVVHDYVQFRNGQVSFKGHGVFTWNAQENVYYLHWFDSMATTVNTFRGQFAGDVLSVDSVDPNMKSRAVFDFGRPDSYTFRMDVSPDGAQWKTFMEGRYARQAEVAPRAKTVSKSKPRAKAKPKAKPKKPAKSPAGRGRPVAKKPKKKAKKK
jgi:hypothetical protein